VHSEVYLNKDVVSIAPFFTPACPDCSQNITNISPGRLADPICPYVRTPMYSLHLSYMVFAVLTSPWPFHWAIYTIGTGCFPDRTFSRHMFSELIRERLALYNYMSHCDFHYTRLELNSLKCDISSLCRLFVRSVLIYCSSEVCCFWLAKSSKFELINS